MHSIWTGASPSPGRQIPAPDRQPLGSIALCACCFPSEDSAADHIPGAAAYRTRGSRMPKRSSLRQLDDDTLVPSQRELAVHLLALAAECGRKHDVAAQVVVFELHMHRLVAE